MCNTAKRKGSLEGVKCRIIKKGIIFSFMQINISTYVWKNLSSQPSFHILYVETLRNIDR
jgi:hypothetical protein